MPKILSIERNAMAKARTWNNSFIEGGGGASAKRFLSKYFNDKNIALLHALCHANRRQRKVILCDADKSLVRCICTFALNTLSGGIKLGKKEKN